MKDQLNTHLLKDPNEIEVTAVIPAYNEQKTIGSVVLGAKRYAKRVVVVDDGSRDATAEIAELAGARIIRHPHNQGKGAALKTGLKAAKDADVIVTLDSDGQHHPQEIPHILEPIVQGRADFVNGSRYMNNIDNGFHHINNNTPYYRRVGQNVLDSATKLNSRMKVTDSQSGFRAFKKNTLDKFSFRSNGYSIESEMLIEAAHAGLKIEEVPIDVSYGEDHQHKKNPLRHGFGVLMKILHEMEFHRPLYYFTIPGIIIIIIGISLSLHFFGQYMAGITYTIVPTAIAVLIIILGAFIAFTGVLLHTLTKMMNKREKKRSLKPNKRPHPKIERS